MGQNPRRPRTSLSIEITKECPLRCPGCYAFDAAHLGGPTQLRELSDFRGDELVVRVLALIDERRPLHVSLVGGDPLVRYRELNLLLPQIESRGIHTQVVTSAFKKIPAAWMKLKKLNVVISVDGLQPEHDERRKPATYHRILEHQGNESHHSLHSHIADRSALATSTNSELWTNRPEVKRVWSSIFTPQRGAADKEIYDCFAESSVISTLRQLRLKYSMLDMPEALIREVVLHHPENQKNASSPELPRLSPPISRRKSRLVNLAEIQMRTVRLHCIDGPRRGRPSSRSGRAHRRKSLHGFGSIR